MYLILSDKESDEGGAEARRVGEGVLGEGVLGEGVGDGDDETIRFQLGEVPPNVDPEEFEKLLVPI